MGLGHLSPFEILARTAATVTPGVNGFVSPAEEERYARMILDILADEPGYARVAAAAQKDLYLNWDDVVRDVYADYCRFLDRKNNSLRQ